MTDFRKIFGLLPSGVVAYGLLVHSVGYILTEYTDLLLKIGLVMMVFLTLLIVDRIACNLKVPNVAPRTLVAFMFGNVLAQKILFEAVTNWSHL